MKDTVLLVLSVCVCIIVLAFVAIIVTWSIKCILEWSDDIAYWWKAFKARHSNHKRCK